MFESLKKAFSKFSKKVEKEAKTEAPKTDKKFKLFRKKKKETKQITLETIPKPKEEKKGFFKKLEAKKVDSLLEELKEELITNNVALSISEKIVESLRTVLKEGKGNLNERIKQELEKTIREVLSVPQINMLPEKKPLVIMFVGVNGVGKTTSIAKLAKWYQDQGKTVVFSASDTFRAAAIEQLEVHAKRLKVHMIKHKYGADPAAVAFDARKHAESKGVQIVIIDTAGRQHASEDLMAELQKIKRVAKPDLTILAVDALTGNDAAEQAKHFDKKIGIDGSVICKVDADDKGGAILSVAYETKKPILFIGTGQKYSDFELFDVDKIMKRLI